ncbi:unnamed protein product [Rhizoctonia solani]|uniref:Uncharacterized protein n=1 Tax=Rhizoctonia solani TaxID=456999 RepID=A0A8H3B937_9AGAM|nr:unnamed protein product [Rhizoctonia solani]
MVDVRQRAKLITISYAPSGDESRLHRVFIPWTDNYNVALESAKTKLRRYFPEGSEDDFRWLALKTEDGSGWTELDADVFPAIAKELEDKTELRYDENHKPKNVTVLPLGRDEDVYYQFKVIILGPLHVGKTMQARDITPAPTVGHRIDFCSRFMMSNGTLLKAELWDTVGQERHHWITPMIYREVDGILLVYNLTKRETFEECEKWRKILEKKLHNLDQLQVVLVGNQLDIEEQREVSVDEAQAYADSHRFKFAEVSAKVGTNVEQVFQTLMDAIFERLSAQDRSIVPFTAVGEIHMAVAENDQQSQSAYLTVTYDPLGQGTTVHAAVIPRTENYTVALNFAKEALQKYFPAGSSDKSRWLAIPVTTAAGLSWAEVSPKVFPEIVKEKKVELRLVEGYQHVSVLPLGNQGDTSYEFKLITIGESGVGKSMMIQHFTKPEDEDVPIILVGNQIDLSQSRTVKTSEGEEFALTNGLLFAEISAKNGTGIEYAFQTLVDEVFGRLHKQNRLSEYETSRKIDNLELDTQQTNRSYLSGCASSTYDTGLYVAERAYSGDANATPHTALIPWTSNYETALSAAKEAFEQYFPPNSAQRRRWLTTRVQTSSGVTWAEFQPALFSQVVGELRVELRLCEDRPNKLDVTVLPIGHEQTTAEGDSYYQFKIITVGQRSVGKSMMLQYFTKPEEDRFESLPNTVGPSMDIANRFMTAHGELVKTVLWDTAGQETFRAMTKPLYRGVHGVFLVYSIADAESFNNCLDWLNEIRGHVDEHVPIMLIGNQIDRIEERAVATSDGQAFALEHGLLFAEISGQYGTNVDNAFQKLVHGRHFIQSPHMRSV